MPDGHDADAFRQVVLERFDMSLGTGLGKMKGKVFRIGHLGDFNDLMLAGTLSGVEMGLSNRRRAAQVGRRHWRPLSIWQQSATDLLRRQSARANAFPRAKSSPRFSRASTPSTRRVNAIVTLVAEQAMEHARLADERIARGESVGPLHGLPIAHKDLQATDGMRTTFGSPIFKDYVPDADSLIVARLGRAGAITVGKTNTPEFGAGSQTFNRVFGATLNPYDLTKTCGGSSGGAAVALACGMLPIADGTDMGGSLRNPAAFCGVVGMRPSTALVWCLCLALSPL